MKSILISGGKLFLICAVAATSLGALNELTEPIIRERRLQELREALSALAGTDVVGEKTLVEDNRLVDSSYPVFDQTGEQALGGYILSLVADGYGGDMAILARFHLTGEIAAVKLMDNLETPGLGKKAESVLYMDKFVGTGGVGNDKKVPVRKDMLPRAQADAVSGATITFMGIAKALAEGSEFVEERESGS